MDVLSGMVTKGARWFQKVTVRDWRSQVLMAESIGDSDD